MVAFPTGFNARQVEPNAALEPLPEGWYTVQIVNSEMKATKDGGGYYLELTMEVAPGQAHQGRKLYDRLNLQNANQQAVEIAQRTLSTLCHVTGRFDATDSMHLHGVPFQAKATVRDGTNGKMNEVRGYRDVNGNDPGKATGGAPAAAPATGNPQASGQWSGQPAPQPSAEQAQSGYGQPAQGGQSWGGPATGAPQTGQAPWGGPAGQPPQTAQPPSPQQAAAAPVTQPNGGQPPAGQAPWGGAAPQPGQGPQGGAPPWGAPNGGNAPAWGGGQ